VNRRFDEVVLVVVPAGETDQDDRDRSPETDQSSRVLSTAFSARHRFGLVRMGGKTVEACSVIRGPPLARPSEGRARVNVKERPAVSPRAIGHCSFKLEHRAHLLWVVGSARNQKHMRSGFSARIPSQRAVALSPCPFVCLPWFSRRRTLIHELRIAAQI
jgi:hypothetical protein